MYIKQYIIKKSQPNFIITSCGLEYEKTSNHMSDFFKISKLVINWRYNNILHLTWNRHVLVSVCKYNYLYYIYTRVDNSIEKQQLYTEYLKVIDNVKTEYCSLKESQKRRANAVQNH